MTDEHDELADAELDIIETQKLIADQRQRIQAMNLEDLDSTMAQDVLRLLRETMDQWYVHRKMILEAIERESQNH